MQPDVATSAMLAPPGEPDVELQGHDGEARSSQIRQADKPRQKPVVLQQFGHDQQS